MPQGKSKQLSTATVTVVAASATSTKPKPEEEPDQEQEEEEEEEEEQIKSATNIMLGVLVLTRLQFILVLLIANAFLSKVREVEAHFQFRRRWIFPY